MKLRPWTPTNRCPIWPRNRNGEPSGFRCYRLRDHLGKCAQGQQLAVYLDSLYREETPEDFIRFNLNHPPLSSLHAPTEEEMLRNFQGDLNFEMIIRDAVSYRDHKTSDYLDQCEDVQGWSEEEDGDDIDLEDIAPWLNVRFVEPLYVGSGLLKARGRIRFSTRGAVRTSVLRHFVLGRREP